MINNNLLHITILDLRLRLRLWPSHEHCSYYNDLLIIIIVFYYGEKWQKIAVTLWVEYCTQVSAIQKLFF